MSDGAILAEVERRKRRAHELGLVDLVFRTYFEGVASYGHRSRKFPEELHPEFRDAAEIAFPKESKAKGVKIPIEGKSFAFSFSEHTSYVPDDENWYGTLSLTVDAQEVFSVSYVGLFNDYDASVDWKPSDIEGFIEGSWIESLKAASAKILAWKESRLQEFERRREATRLEGLKKKFGL